jgi:hypothetical protein
MPHLNLFVDINRTITLVDSVQHKDVETSVGELAAEAYVLPSGRNYKQETLVRGGSDAEHYEAFRQLLTQLADKPQLQALEAKLRAAIASQQGPVFRSFILLLQRLRSQEIPHTVVLRSFGISTAEVIAALEAAVPGVQFTVQGKFLRGQLHVNETLVSPRRQMTRGRYQSWQDDHTHWKGGKPFPMDDLTLFLDDNAARKEIIAVPPNVRNTLLVSGHLVAVDTTEALVDEEYFWRLVTRHLTK